MIPQLFLACMWKTIGRMIWSGLCAMVFDFMRLRLVALWSSYCYSGVREWIKYKLILIGRSSK